MRMSDIISAMGLVFFPILALGLFLTVFVGVLVQVMRRSKRAEYDAAAMLPLESCGLASSEMTTGRTSVKETTDE